MQSEALLMLGVHKSEAAEKVSRHASHHAPQRELPPILARQHYCALDHTLTNLAALTHGALPPPSLSAGIHHHAAGFGGAGTAVQDGAQT